MQIKVKQNSGNLSVYTTERTDLKTPQEVKGHCTLTASCLSGTWHTFGPGVHRPSTPVEIEAYAKLKVFG